MAERFSFRPSTTARNPPIHRISCNLHRSVEKLPLPGANDCFTAPASRSA